MLWICYGADAKRCDDLVFELQCCHDIRKANLYFGRFAPVLGLTLSMIFRFVPLLRTRFELIREGQRALYAGDEKSFVGKIRQLGKEVSILVSWSLDLR